MNELIYKSNNKNLKIQILRAIAIIAVVAIHTMPKNEMSIILRPLVNFAVPLFIFLSGYLTKIQIDNVKQFYKRRILRVLIPYIIWSILYTIANAIIRDEINISIFKTFIINLITTESCYIFYYIAVYIQLVLITPLLIKIINSKYKWLPFLIQPIWIILIMYVLNIVNKPLNSPWNGYFFMTWFAFYYFGILLGNKILNVQCKRRNLIILYCLAVEIQIFEAIIWYKVIGNYGVAVSQAKLSNMISSLIFLTLCYMYICKDKKQVNILQKILIKIGDFSFGIFLCHPAIIMVMNKISIYQMLPFPINTIIILIVSSVCIIAGKKILGIKLSKYIGLE